jgi:AbrB family looped-hinge helix DNA binding protein
MSVARSKLTRQGQISIPAEVRRKLGIGPGSVIEWDEQSGQIIVRRSGQYVLADTRAALGLDQPPARRSLEALREGIRQRMRARHARR